jgi:hypothetical protein
MVPPPPEDVDPPLGPRRLFFALDPRESLAEDPPGQEEAPAVPPCPAEPPVPAGPPWVVRSRVHHFAVYQPVYRDFGGYRAGSVAKPVGIPLANRTC